MPNIHEKPEGYYLSAEEMKAAFNRRFGSNPRIRFYTPVGNHGNMSALSEPDMDGYVDSRTGEKVPSLPELLNDPGVETIIIPIHHSSDRSGKKTDSIIGRVPYGKDHWDGYVLERGENGTFEAFHLTTPSDGYCAQHFIEMATEIASEGLPAFMNSNKSSHLCSLQADSLSESTQTDAAKLVSLGVELFSPQELKKPKKRVRFSPQFDQVKEFDTTKPVSPAHKPVDTESVSETEPALMPVEKESVTEKEHVLIKADLEKMSNVQDFVKKYLKKHFSNEHTVNGTLLEIWEKAVACEPAHQDFLKKKDFSKASSERRVECLAISASINPDFEKWIKKFSAAGYETMPHRNTARLRAKESLSAPGKPLRPASVVPA
jgi:hypothetical protein